MLEITFYRDGHDRVAGLGAHGHADFADYGQDIVCAAVSAILQAVRLGLEHYAGGELDARQEPGELSLIWAEGSRDAQEVQAIITTAELAIAHVARRFPEHVSLQRRRIAEGMGGGAPPRLTSGADQRRPHV